MQNAMNALQLDATWEPRFIDSLTPLELKTRKAFNANTVWRNPKLELGESAIPQIHDDEVLIKVKACGVCGSDVHCYETDKQGYVLFSGSVRLPVILGHEYSGEIIEVGKKVAGLKLGDAVTAESILWCGICLACRTGHLNQCQRLEIAGFSAPGAFAEYIAAKEKYCWNLETLKHAFPNDDEVYEIGALIEPIGCAFNGMFIVGGGFRPGAYVAIYGAGPLGLSAMLMAQAAGAAKIFMFDISEPRNQLARALGADYAANPIELKRKGISASEVIREMTSGYGVDMQIEAAGAASMTLPEIERSFAPNGKMVYLGRQDNGASIPFDTLVSQANQIMGARGHAGYGIYSNIIRLLATGRIPAHKMITSRFPFNRVIDAIKQAAARMEGKVMVRFP